MDSFVHFREEVLLLKRPLPRFEHRYLSLPQTLILLWIHDPIRILIERNPVQFLPLKLTPAGLSGRLLEGKVSATKGVHEFCLGIDGAHSID
jgi:hypothetical protein